LLPNLHGKLREAIFSESGKVFLIGLSSRLVVFIAVIAGAFLFGPSQSYSGIPIVSLFNHWDAGWYTKIALFGYPVGTNPLSGNWAFFPFYPFLMRLFGTPFFAVMSPTDAVALSGFAISNVLFFASIFLFYRVTKIIFNSSRFSLISTIFFALWPGALFYSTVYSESLFMFFALAAFYLLEKGHSGKSAALGFFAALTRSNGFLVLIPFAYHALQTRKYRTGIYQAIVIALPYFLFSVYGYFSTGLFPIREIVYNHTWGASRLVLTDVITNQTGYVILFSAEIVLLFIPFLWFIFSEKISISDFVRGTKVERKDLKYWAFSIYILLMLAFYSDPKNIQRYALPILPLYWVFALVYDENKKAGSVLLIASTVILIIGSILFATGGLFL
jgi:hypothetical protein